MLVSCSILIIAYMLVSCNLLISGLVISPLLFFSLAFIVFLFTIAPSYAILPDGWVNLLESLFLRGLQWLWVWKMISLVNILESFCPRHFRMVEFGYWSPQICFHASLFFISHSPPASMGLLVVFSYCPIKDTIWLHYFRLWHPFFGLLKRMFPSLLKGLIVDYLHCDVCEVAKDKNAFSISNQCTLFNR